MSKESRVDDSSMTVLLDLRHPMSYLALGPTIELGRQRAERFPNEPPINWLPVSMPALNPPSTKAAGDDRGIRHRRSRAQMIAREIEVYAAAQGLVLRDYYRSGASSAFELAWLVVRDAAPDRLEAFLTESFRAYWAGELAPDEVEAVSAVVEAVAGCADTFRAAAARDGMERVEALAADLNARGLAGAPGYWVAGQFFLGRQHLPMIEWLLDGEKGPGPI